MKPSYFPVTSKIVDLSTKDSTQVRSWEAMLIEASELLSLTEPQYTLICNRYETLQNILTAAEDPLLHEAHIFVQGSIGLKTAIKPAKNATDDMATVDADAIILLPNAGNASADEILMAIEKRFRDGSRVQTPVQQLRRGIRITYADENPGFHMDITPARLSKGNTDDKGFGYLEVPDRVTGWKASSPRSYSKWLDQIANREIRVVLDHTEFAQFHRKLAEATQDPLPEYDSYVSGNPLRVAIKLIKRHRDEWAIKTKQQDARPISAILTTLATLAYAEVVEESQHTSIKPIEAILKIVEKMPKFVEFDAAGNAYVKNPIDSRENFAEKWNRPDGEGTKYRIAFSNWYASARETFAIGFEQLGSISKLEEVVGQSFGIPTSRIQSIIDTFPRNWTLPGLKAGESLNTLSTTALFGAGFSASKSQAETAPVKRLG